MNKDKIADLSVLLVLAGLVVLYGIDSIQASTHVLNLILVLPVTVAVLVLCAIQFVIDVPQLRQPAQDRKSVSHVFPVMALFAAYVISLEWLGFDVGTFVFLVAFLWLHGERRWPWLFGYAISFAALMVLFFSTMLPYPMPMLILNTAY
ncbi:MAG: tripartite tricarboxylate transporter TctB family protein [Gammaproteobacteria bacterium]|nr:tripartite tricarboxylate transporter TctB family protein [Gammaproteobacteria bacterium]